ncbi:kinase-like domain-containing protein [Scenedesmus sp. NREL 46B-D3]|nr:kinase-like domain-containing protein [Scenedesmus sp. NREL 46B-D3]
MGAPAATAAAATEYGANWPKAWHHWALFNCGVLEALHKRGEAAAAAQYVAPAVTGFFRSVALGQAAGDRTGNLQDILRLLTLWFTWGSAPDVEAALQEGFGLVSIDTWLVVIPQIIARIHTNNPQVRSLIHSLLVRIGRHHPQALMYPLLVAAKSQSPSRRQAAYAVLDVVRTHSATLVEQAQLVSQELIRIAILWHEMWHEALEEASRLYFGESNVEAMLGVLLPLHELMEKTGPSTLKEIAFVQAYGRELSEAYEWLSKYRLSRKEAELHQAWDLYYHVFKRINKQLHSLTTLELQYVAPALVRAQGMELAVPGTYIAGEPLVTIAAFAPQLQVISSKQRPRKLTIHGGDGAEYMFLLKGHEDLRQDERVMQLFGLVNSMLCAERSTAERDLSIARYAVIPLSPNSGLIGWVPNCDTLHALIREYRESRKIPLNWEHRLMLGMAPDYDHLPVINKVEVFEYALDSTSGEDLHKASCAAHRRCFLVLWLKSRNSEIWLDRRTTYTRSTAVMSMVGYLLGLGDRHPSNLMLGPASMNRDKFPEKVPFRLTRMMIKAMEVSGIEGNFRTTCEAVLRVLRQHKDSLMVRAAATRGR